jgi:hypothetical protein
MSISAMKQALEALEEIHRTGDTQAFDLCYAPNVIPALRQAIADAEKREWVGLTDDEFQACFDHADGTLGSLMYAIEAKLKEKNT